MRIKTITYILWILIYFGANLSFALTIDVQNLHSNSIESQVPSPNEISKQLNYAKSIFNDSLQESLAIVENNLSLAIQLGYKNEEAKAQSILGEFNSQLKNYNAAKRNFQKAIAIYTSLNDKLSLVAVYSLSGDVYSKQKDYNSAIGQWELAENIASQSKSLKQKAIDLELKIGNEFLKTPTYNKAKPYFQKALSQSEEINYKTGIASANIGLGKIEEKNGSNIEAEQLFQSANQTATDINSVELTNSSYNSLSNLYQNTNNNVESIKIQEQAIDFNNNIGNSAQVIQNSTEMANILIEEGEDDKAIEILNQSSGLIKTQNNSETKRNYYKTLSKAYEASGDIDKSNIITKKFTSLMDSFKILEAQKAELILTKNDFIQNTENKISLLEKDREINEKTIQLLKQDQVIKDESLKRQKTIMYFLIIGLLLVATIIFFVIRSNKQKQKNNQLLKLKSLRNQMNPHFIFNSLNSVNVYIAQQDERAANKYLADFSKLMRAVLNYSQNDFIPLAKELEILTLYLNLEHDRFKENFDFKIDCPESIDLEAYQIPPMLLQPIVENAIWHGLRYKPEKGFLNIEFLELTKGLKITVTDDGIGREASLNHKTANQLKMKSTGIKNVKDRLEIIKAAFKKELSIEIEDLNSETKAGTIVTILLKN